MRREEVNKRKGLRGGKEWIKGKKKVKDKSRPTNEKKKEKRYKVRKLKREQELLKRCKG